MTNTWCPDLSGDTAVALVGAAHSTFIERSTQTYNSALQQLTALSSIKLEPYEFSVSFNYANPQATFVRPQKPNLDTADLQFKNPGTDLAAAPAFSGTNLVIDDAPGFDDIPVPTIAYNAQPNTPNVAVPTEPAGQTSLVMPYAPNYTLPAPPTFESLNLPVVPAVALPEWALDTPKWEEPNFTEAWTFQPEAYTSTLVSTLVEALKPMIQAPAGLPVVIERALFDRNRSRIEVETSRAVDQVWADSAGRGFDIPQGISLDQVRQLRQNAQGSMAEASRDVLIRQMELALEQQRFAITQGAALEATLIELHNQRQSYLLQAATFARDSALAVLNYRVQVFQMRMTAYQAEASVFRDRIQAELGKVEVYRAQLDGQRMIGEMNDQLVRRYTAQIQAVNSIADFYRTQVETVRIQADIQMQAIEKYRAQIQGYTARWQAYQAEIGGYTAGIQAQAAKVDLYRSMVDAQAKRIDAWATASNIEVERAKLNLSEHNQQLTVWRAGLEKMEALLGVERARLTAVGQSWDAQARIYAASADVESSASAAADRSFQLGLESERENVDTQLKVAEMKTRNTEFLAQQMAEIQRAIAQIAAQLAASTMSAVNYGASISSGRSKSSSCSTNFSFSGETSDA